MGKKHFNKGDTRRHMKRCSALLTTKEMQIKTTLRYLSNQLKLKKKKIWQHQMLGRFLKKKERKKENELHIHFWQKFKIVQPLWKDDTFLKK